MRNFFRVATTIACAVVLTAAALAQSLQISFSPNKSRYARGESLTIVYTVRDAGGNRVANAPLLAWRYIQSTGNYFTYPTAFTDANGQVRIPYTIPLDPNKDNIYYYGVAVVNGVSTNEANQRIPIGLP